MKNPYRNKRLVIPVFVTLFIIWSIFVYARSSGMTGRTLISGTEGCSCHNTDPTPSVVVTLSGPLQIDANQTASYSVTVEGGPLAAAGINIATDNGTLAPVDGSLQSTSGELTHTNPKAPSGNAVTFEFEYTAPATSGTAFIEATGNSVNLANGNQGDAWNFAEGLLITVNPPSSIKDSNLSLPFAFELGQNYPNPFNPSTNINYSLNKASLVSLEVYNLLGQRVSTLVNEYQNTGNYAVKFDGANLESGTYIYRLNVDGESQTRRMSLIK